MPTRDSIDSISYSMDYWNTLDDSFGRISHYARRAGVETEELSKMIARFMDCINNEYFEDEPIEEISYDEVMCFNEEVI